MSPAGPPPADYEAPLKPAVSSRGTESHSESQPQSPSVHWVAALGTGGFHFPVIDTNSVRFTRAVQTLEQLKRTKTLAQHKKTFLEHDAHAPVQPSLSAYEINGQRFVSGLKKVTKAQGERTRLHWLYSQSSDAWNILSHANK